MQASAPVLSLIDGPFTIVSFQSRPLAFRIDSQGQIPLSFSFEIAYKIESKETIQKTRPFVVNLTQRSIHDAHRFTFLHPSRVVSYAILRPPLNSTCPSGKNRNFPVLLSLHGAGLEADSDLVRHMLDGAYGVCAWMLFPTGVTPWSGDDWREFSDAVSEVDLLTVK